MMFSSTYGGKQSCREFYTGDLDNAKRTIATSGHSWNFLDGGTDFGPPVEMFFDKIDANLRNYETVDYYFFTDGEASYPK